MLKIDTNSNDVIVFYFIYSLWKDKCSDDSIDESTREIRIKGRPPLQVYNPWKQVIIETIIIIVY